MNPVDKLREDLKYWEEADRNAREVLTISEGLLPALRERLAAAELGTQERPSTENVPESIRESQAPPASPEPTDVGENSEPAVKGGAPRFTGRADQQVEQALRWRSPQSSLDLEASLKNYGRPYRLGAIGYALRDLAKAGKVRETRKEGNLRYFELVTADE